MLFGGGQPRNLGELAPTGKRTVVVNDQMQRGYRYLLAEQMGENFDPDFKRQLTPK